MLQKRSLAALVVGIFAAVLTLSSGSAAALVNTTDTDTSTGTYAALGDSVAAGLGLASEGVCGRSAEGLNYPSLVASALNVPLTDASCSGATVGDLFTRQSVSGTNIPAQLDTAFAEGTPSLITMTAGANDLHWAEILQACLSATNCDKASYTLTVKAYLALTTLKLHYAFNNIAWRSHGKAHAPKVIVTGYYNPMSTACTSQIPTLTTSEVNWITRQSQALNKVLEEVSSHYSFVKFAPVNFDGQEACTPNPRVQGLTSPAPFHPTAQGQRVIAGAVLAAAQE